MAVTFDITPEKRATPTAFLKRQLFRQPPLATRSEVDLAGKCAIVTGSNTGLGLECSRQLLDLGLSKLILAVRSETKGEAARRDLLSGRTSSKHTIEVWMLDLSAYDSITSFVERTKSLDRLDIFVHNAGLSKKTLELNPTTGHDEVVQVNYLSCALLSILMLPVLKAKNSPQTPGRLVVVNSETAAWAAFKEKTARPILPAFDKPENFSNQDRYPTSKLLGQLFLMELVKRIPPSVAVVNCANPGMCRSNLMGDFAGPAAVVFGIINRILGRSTQIGARAITDASVKHGEDSHGQYLEDGKLQPMAPIVYKTEGQELAKVIWEETMNELKFADVDKIVQGLSG